MVKSNLSKKLLLAFVISVSLTALVGYYLYSCMCFTPGCGGTICQQGWLTGLIEPLMLFIIPVIAFLPVGMSFLGVNGALPYWVLVIFMWPVFFIFSFIVAVALFSNIRSVSS